MLLYDVINKDDLTKMNDPSKRHDVQFLFKIMIIYY